MTINAVKGQDIRVDAPSYAIFRINGFQWRIASDGGIATLSGKWTRAMSTRGGRAIKGFVWVGKTKHDLYISPR